MFFKQRHRWPAEHTWSIRISIPCYILVITNIIPISKCTHGQIVIVNKTRNSEKSTVNRQGRNCRQSVNAFSDQSCIKVLAYELLEFWFDFCIVLDHRIALMISKYNIESSVLEKKRKSWGTMKTLKIFIRLNR